MSAPTFATPLDRAAAALRAFVVSVFPQLLYFVVHEYSVQECDGSTFTGVPTDATFSPPLPVGVPYAPALAGATSVVPAGTLAYVGFANADPSKPYLVRFGSTATSTTTTIDATSQVAVGASSPAVILAGASAVSTSPTTAASERRVVCYGDPVVIGVTSGTIALAPASSCSKVRA
jgi:hypothetical protein